MRSSSQSGFTAVELLVSIAIASVLLTIGAINLASFRGKQSLSNETQSLVALLSSAREKSMGQDEEGRWGVFIKNESAARDTYSLFLVDEALYASSSYTLAPGTVIDARTVRSGIEFISPSTGSSTTIVFGKVSGLPNTSTSIQIANSSSDEYHLIYISGNGRIDFE